MSELYQTTISAGLKQGEEPRDWHFTFGCGDPEHAGRYVVINGTFAAARDEMVRRFGTQWAFQYASAADAGVVRWGLRRLELEQEVP